MSGRTIPLRVTIHLDYDAEPEHYHSDDPKLIAQEQAEQFEESPELAFDFLSTYPSTIEVTLREEEKGTSG